MWILKMDYHLASVHAYIGVQKVTLTKLQTSDLP